MKSLEFKASQVFSHPKTFKHTQSNTKFTSLPLKSSSAYPALESILFSGPKKRICVHHHLFQKSPTITWSPTVLKNGQNLPENLITKETLLHLTFFSPTKPFINVTFSLMGIPVLHIGAKTNFLSGNYQEFDVWKMWSLWKMRLWKYELCEKWDFENVNCVKNEILKMWILSNLRFQKCDFVKYAILKK